MKVVDADKFLSYLIYSKHIDGLTCGEVKEAIEMCKVDIEPQEPTGKYEKHIDHTDCIWYDGSNGGCPVTCSQYRDGWNDAMDYIFKDGKGYQPYRHDG